MRKHLTNLKIAAFVVGAIGMYLAHEQQKRDTREMIEEVLAEREAEAQTQLPSDYQY